MSVIPPEHKYNFNKPVPASKESSSVNKDENKASQQLDTPNTSSKTNQSSAPQAPTKPPLAILKPGYKKIVGADGRVYYKNKQGRYVRREEAEYGPGEYPINKQNCRDLFITCAFLAFATPIALWVCYEIWKFAFEKIFELGHTINKLSK